MSVQFYLHRVLELTDFEVLIKNICVGGRPHPSTNIFGSGYIREPSLNHC